jgi:hypothetical protein
MHKKEKVFNKEEDRMDYKEEIIIEPILTLKDIM